MKRSTTDSALGGVLTRFRFLLPLLVLAISGVSIALVAGERIGTSMHSVQLTQKGYIQVRIGHSRVDLRRFRGFRRREPTFLPCLAETPLFVETI